ncbi:small-conductance mechanosensitive channel protein [Vairimorpha apis BRL 01]|uniref:Small-conductance mechanosensitive channel protein n=1 Tax=Vairimorpha apis BRL 01 TaxID=1037528 RepID=T0MMZ2_9MICR|nr:small-conductance mechanosensitive channel protein [Vairimorpha apis BRL 01]
MSILGNTKHLTAIFTIITGCFFSLSFVFGPVIGDLFKSIIFIFLVKPFEVGDIIEFDGLTYVVEEPGLMYSTLKHDSLMTIVHNNKIMDKNIINYRISEFIEKNYEFRFNIYFYKNNINIIKQSIKKLLRKYSYTFEEKFFLNNIHLLDNNNIIVCIKVKAHLHSVNYEEEIDKFGIELSQLINNIINLDQENTNINLTKMSNSNILNIDENKENMIVNDNLITSELKNEDLKKLMKK